MKKIGIHGRAINEASRESVGGLLNLLRRRDYKPLISESFADHNNEFFQLDDLSIYGDHLDSNDVDCIFSLGGDGTLLEAVTHVGSSETPILGINTGRLGFLATTNKDDFNEALSAIENDRFKLENRSLVELKCDQDLFGGKNFALNEFAILRKETSSMITIECYLNGDYLSTYWADGLMVSTPTGSTGYSLSCGGPVLLPSTKNFILTPVSPHNLNVRPFVIADNGHLRFKMDSRETNVLVSLDSRSETVPHDLELTISKADFTIKLIKLEGDSFVDTLRTKLGWGYDKRN